MPHFIMDCSESVFGSHSEEYIIEQIHFAAHATGLLVVFRNLCHFSIIKKTGVTHDSIFRLQQSIS
ncbi:hypothetical protein ND6B_0054 [Pseudoalteromonas sp. ND6B]|nr:hypothetical protein ND6B_0054 [Pseudoalteromonas sp. ND6B]